ncbi:MAG TPA: recombinase family protein, partial [Burkholderiales bacterium]|nr:recombinase family protein [Burkholderiales bacterium]
ILKVADQILRAGTEQTVGSEGGGVMPRLNGQRVAVYARVSTFAQDPENQLQELRRYVEARGWTAVEYVDRGVSGAKDKLLANGQMRPRSNV